MLLTMFAMYLQHKALFMFMSTFYVKIKTRSQDSPENIVIEI